jgi:type IV pilus assembly protein PilO
VNLSDLRSLDFSDLGSWPVLAKSIFILLLCAALLGAGYWLDTRHQMESLQNESSKEPGLKKTLETKWEKAANLEAYRRQMAEIKETFGLLLRQLPDKAEIAALLVDISETGLANGLEFDLFKPQPEVLKDFYAEKPIDIRVTGTYHEFGSFVSGVSNLPRIVTLHNFTIVPKPTTAAAKEKTKGQEAKPQEPVLTMDITAKTYRYVEEEGVPTQPARKGAAKKGGAKK